MLRIDGQRPEPQGVRVPAGPGQQRVHGVGEDELGDDERQEREDQANVPAPPRVEHDLGARLDPVMLVHPDGQLHPSACHAAPMRTEDALHTASRTLPPRKVRSRYGLLRANGARTSTSAPMPAERQGQRLARREFPGRGRPLRPGRRRGAGCRLMPPSRPWGFIRLVASVPGGQASRGRGPDDRRGPLGAKLRPAGSGTRVQAADVDRPRRSVPFGACRSPPGTPSHRCRNGRGAAGRSRVALAGDDLDDTAGGARAVCPSPAGALEHLQRGDLVGPQVLERARPVAHHHAVEDDHAARIRPGPSGSCP